MNLCLAILIAYFSHSHSYINTWEARSKLSATSNIIFYNRHINQKPRSAFFPLANEKIMIAPALRFLSQIKQTSGLLWKLWVTWFRFTIILLKIKVFGSKNSCMKSDIIQSLKSNLPLTTLYTVWHLKNTFICASLI